MLHYVMIFIMKFQGFLIIVRWCCRCFKVCKQWNIVLNSNKAVRRRILYTLKMKHRLKILKVTYN